MLRPTRWVQQQRLPLVWYFTEFRRRFPRGKRRLKKRYLLVTPRYRAGGQRGGGRPQSRSPVFASPLPAVRNRAQQPTGRWPKTPSEQRQTRKLSRRWLAERGRVGDRAGPTVNVETAGHISGCRALNSVTQLQNGAGQWILPAGPPLATRFISGSGRRSSPKRGVPTRNVRRLHTFET
jgi:hypothetical protein